MSTRIEKKAKGIEMYFIRCIYYINIVLILCIAVASQYYYDKENGTMEPKLLIAKKTLIPAAFIPYMHFGFANVLADYYWISSIQDLPAWNGQDRFYLDYFDNMTTLDPRFEYAYLFGIFTAPSEKNIPALDRIASIGERGIAILPTEWKIPFYLSTKYNILTKSDEKVEKYLRIAAETPNAPSVVYIVYSSFIAKKIQGKEAYKEMIKVIYDTTDNEIIKKLAEKGILEENITQMLEKGVIAYKAKYKIYPNSVDDLIRNRFINLPQEVLESFIITIYPKTGEVKVTGRSI